MIEIRAYTAMPITRHQEAERLKVAAPFAKAAKADSWQPPKGNLADIAAVSIAAR